MDDIDLKLTAQTNGNFLNLCLTAPAYAERRPVAFVAVIDVSGSMNEIVGVAEGSKGFTRLDLVKHVLNVLITSLNESDHLCLITFSDETEIVFPLTQMNEESKVISKMKVQKLATQRSTRTKTAITFAYQLIADAPEECIQSIILLTDGQDNEVEVLSSHFDSIQKPSHVQFNTFGFSSDIFSHLLQDLALKGGGIFGYIPDQTMIGTIFINFLANTFLTYKQGIQIDIPNSNFEFVNPKQTHAISINFGQSRNFLLKQKKVDQSQPLSIKLWSNNRNEIELVAGEVVNGVDLTNQLARNKVLEFCFDKKLPKISEKSYEDAAEIVQTESFLREFKELNPADQNEQQLKLSLKYWQTWGEHYIRSFVFSHLNEQCLNFKAPSMQIYKTPEFESLTNQLTDLFCNLDPPKPTGRCFKKVFNLPVITNMSILMDADGGCILETCKVKLESGLYKPIGELRKGEVLSNGAKVICLIKAMYDKPLIKIGKLVITAYHPIYYNQNWVFPNDILNEIPQMASVINLEHPSYVCNIVLDKSHIIDVEGIECVTLGHGFQNSVLKHSYYGSKAVINDYSKFNGWSDGLVKLKRYSCVKDEYGLICSTTAHEYDS